ncbi:MAG: class I SAM-dependent methyltransferase, partial [Candidatus Berkelbacteria bacterium]
MKELPDSKIYELEMNYWPYKTSWRKVLELIVEKSPKNGALLDVMCGPGYLLGQIAQKRKDLELSGQDFDKRYISYSKKTYPNIGFELGDILTWKPKELSDVVTCTGSVHHMPYELQAKTVERIAEMVKPGGFAIISDCFIDDYGDERERKLAAAKLGYEYLRETIENGAPNEAIVPALDILWN